MRVSSRQIRAAAVFVSLLLVTGGLPARSSGSQTATPPRTPEHPAATETTDARPDFARMQREQADTDRAWRQASEGYMRMEKITYRSARGDLQIPAFVFQPLETAGIGRHAALV